MLNPHQNLLRSWTWPLSASFVVAWKWPRVWWIWPRRRVAWELVINISSPPTSTYYLGWCSNHTETSGSQARCCGFQHLEISASVWVWVKNWAHINCTIWYHHILPVYPWFQHLTTGILDPSLLDKKLQHPGQLLDFICFIGTSPIHPISMVELFSQQNPTGISGHSEVLGFDLWLVSLSYWYMSIGCPNHPQKLWMFRRFWQFLKCEAKYVSKIV